MKKLALGMMSGTSGDGISLALVEVENRRIRIIDYATHPYPKGFSITSGGPPGPAQLSKLHFKLGQLFVRAALSFLRKSGVSASRISVIGSHGHTVYHGPGDAPRNTLQLGEPSLIAEATGIPVVSDFRTRDIAAGGEGAPLIPFFDFYFFGNGPVRALQNIGGMANVTLVGKNKRPMAFDNGPGNVLMDWAVKNHTRGRLAFDKNGHLASRGVIDLKAVRILAAHPYFSRKPPKSTGRELFNPDFLPDSLKLKNGLDLIATLTYFTAYTIHESYLRFLPVQPAEIIVSGGGALNPTLMGHLSNLFYPMPVRSIEAFGMHVQAKEPAAFAFFALRALEGKINHLPQTTGARHARVLGKITPANPAHAAA